MAAVARHSRMFPDPQMKPSLVTSLLFHGLIVAVTIIGLPHVKPELPPLPEAVAVELVNVDEITATNKPPENTARRPPPQQTKPEPPKRSMPQVTSKTPPKPAAPARPDSVDDIPVPQEPVEEETPKAAPPPPKPVQRPEVARPDAPPAEEEQQEDFQSLLRNLMPNEDPPVRGQDPQATGTTPPAPFAPRMSVSELDSLRRQLNQCWSVLAGARYAENLIVELQLIVNPDRTIRHVQIKDQLRYNTDRFFRAAADAAQRAVFRCSPLDLPPNKYDLWNTITVTFDPRKML